MFLELMQKPILMENFTFLQDLEETLYTGDPELRKWFLVKDNYSPFVLCTLYVLFVKFIGPMIMKNRKPLELRNTMVIYNFLLVGIYFVCISNVLYLMCSIETSILCNPVVVSVEDSSYQIHNLKNVSRHEVFLEMATFGWVIYLLKYVEFLDTIFFILRKKDNLVTNLHVIHHFLLPLIGWILFRTEKSGFQAFPIIINSMVHIVMYTYYGLAAMGPKVRKYLWWKRYLTIAQMVQFILIVTFVVVIMPLTGCTAAKTSLLIDVVGALFFFALFYNFYQHTFKGKGSKVKGN